MFLSWPLLHRWVQIYDEGVPYGKRCRRCGKEIPIGDKPLLPLGGG